MSAEQETQSVEELELQQARDALQDGPVSQDERSKVVRLLQSQQRKLAGLEEQLRKQEYDFTTVMEMTNQIIARSVDASGLETFISYIRSTFQGHFGVRDVYIIYRQDLESDLLSPPERDSIDVSLHSESKLASYLTHKDDPVTLDEISSELDDDPELQKLSDLGVELVLALNRRMNTEQNHLQGVLLLGPKMVDETYTEANRQFLSLLGRMIAISLHNAALYQKSIHDSLTGLYTRGHFDYRLTEKIEELQSLNQDRPLSVIMLDLDHFKRFNDEYGHQTGDALLQSVSDVLRTNTRPEDLLARYGGEEFVVSAPDTDPEHGEMIAQRLRKNVKDTPFSVNGHDLRVTLSAGVSTYPTHSREHNTLIAKADEALYKAKESGRDDVVVANHDDFSS